MKRKLKSKLEKYIYSKKNHFGEEILIRDLNLDKNIKVLETKEINGQYIIWVEGFGERDHFFVKLNNSVKNPYYYLSKES